VASLEIVASIGLYSLRIMNLLFPVAASDPESQEPNQAIVSKLGPGSHCLVRFIIVEHNEPITLLIVEDVKMYRLASDVNDPFMKLDQQSPRISYSGQPTNREGKTGSTGFSRDGVDFPNPCPVPIRTRA
jgi:hypothetical protein